MKMRILLVGFAMGMATTLFGVVNGSNVFGQIECTSPYEKTIVAIPWVSTNATATAHTIKIAEIIQTTNLKNGTMALHWNGSSWDGWIITDGVWESMAAATADASGVGVAVSAPAPEAVVNRGSAIWLIRPKADYTKEGETTPDYSAPFYIYGKYDPVTCSATVPAGTKNVPKYTLMSAPFAVSDGYNLNGIAAATWAGFGTTEADGIRVQTGTAPYYKEYSFRNEQGWGEVGAVTKTWNATKKRYTYEASFTLGCTIPAGHGFWYVNRSVGDITIAWPGEQSQASDEP